ncbi:MAG: hypothetical protein RJA55_1443 [Acidobacteriota bacterium]|jgi:hypothetical protein
MTIMQCMGGWCRSRDKCAHYVAAGIPGRAPVERLCEPRLDEPQTMKVANKVIHMPAQEDVTCQP